MKKKTKLYAVVSDEGKVLGIYKSYTKACKRQKEYCEAMFTVSYASIEEVD
jgi:hypothetical protein